MIGDCAGLIISRTDLQNANTLSTNSIYNLPTVIDPQEWLTVFLTNLL
jgi:hypothetical protein